jgi:hypothetical protein
VAHYDDPMVQQLELNGAIIVGMVVKTITFDPI